LGKEIERKWLCSLTDELLEYMTSVGGFEIKDYYFNQYTRLRYSDGQYKITVKSLGNIIRDEYEFTVQKNEINFVPAPCLVKKRIIFPYKGHDFEINVFKDIRASEDGRVTNLIVAELELGKEDEVFELPDFCKKEVTYDSAFYGYNLYNRIKHDPDKEILCRF